MIDQTVSAYGVIEADTAGSEMDLRYEELRRLGYTLLDSGLGPHELDAVREKVFEVYALQEAEFEGESLGESNDADIARALLAYDRSFFELATNPALLQFAGRVFGENFVLLQQNGVINRPARGNYQLRWHRDLPFQHWIPSRPIAFAAMFCVDEFNPTTGGTYALPGSQAHEAFPSDEFVRRHQEVMSAPAGTFIVMDAMMFHRAGKNSSPNIRIGINHLIGLPFLGQQIDLPRMLDGAYADDPFLARYLGYKWNPAPSLNEWRRSRMNP